MRRIAVNRSSLAPSWHFYYRSVIAKKINWEGTLSAVTFCYFVLLFTSFFKEGTYQLSAGRLISSAMGLLWC